MEHLKQALEAIASLEDGQPGDKAQLRLARHIAKCALSQPIAPEYEAAPELLSALTALFAVSDCDNRESLMNQCAGAIASAGGAV